MIPPKQSCQCTDGHCTICSGRRYATHRVIRDDKEIFVCGDCTSSSDTCIEDEFGWLCPQCHCWNYDGRGYLCNDCLVEELRPIAELRRIAARVYIP